MKDLKMQVWLIVLCLFLWEGKTMDIFAQQNKSEVLQHTEEDDDKVYEIVDYMPYYISKVSSKDVKAIFEFIAKHIKYPEDAWRLEKQGTVMCEFVINKDGSFSDIKVRRGVYPSLDKEAVRVIGTFPKWKPGVKNGKKVQVRYTLPIIFRMRDVENK